MIFVIIRAATVLSYGLQSILWRVEPCIQGGHRILYRDYTWPDDDSRPGELTAAVHRDAAAAATEEAALVAAEEAPGESVEPL